MFRQYLFLILLSLGLAFVSGGLFWYIEKDRKVAFSDVSVSDVIEKFQRDYSFQKSLDSKILLNHFPHQSLYDPKDILPRTSDYSVDILRGLKGFQENCNFQSSFNSKSLSINKALALQKYVCLKQSIPKNFFQNPPYVHPFGGSYAYYFYSNDKNHYWNQEELKYLHLLEWKKLPKEARESHTYGEIFASIDLNSLEDIIMNNDLILTSDAVWLKNSSYEGRVYNIFKKEEFLSFIAERALFLKRYKEGSVCSLREGKLCWEYNYKGKYKTINAIVVFSLIAISLLIVFIIRLFYNSYRKEELDKERKDFIIKVISHEMRSPITGLNLSIENIKKHFDNLPEEVLPYIVNIFDQTSRLSKITEKSKQYLHISDNIKIKPESNSIASMREYLASILDSYKGIAIKTNNFDDFSLNTDAYWLSVVIRNLIENAIKHGKPPISIFVNKKNESIYFEIKDCGEKNLNEEMFKTFSKGKKSSGLGLGLFLTKEIVKSLNGKIDFESNPTTFKVEIKDLK